MVAPDPFRTEQPIGARGMATFRAIASRFAALNPPLVIERHIAQDTRRGKTQYSTLQAHESTLDGIDFVADDPASLAHLLYSVTDGQQARAFASVKDDPNHWPLKASFRATDGTGWREIWRPAPYTAYRAAAGAPPPGTSSTLMRMRFGPSANPVSFTSLHCAVNSLTGGCNIHIDESGFVLELPDGVVLTPDLYGHFVNELLVKTIFRDWLSGKTSHQAVRQIVRDAIRRVSFTFPTAANGYAGLAEAVQAASRVRGPLDVPGAAARVLAPTGISIEVYDNERFTVQVNATRVNGLGMTVSIGGRW